MSVRSGRVVKTVRTLTRPTHEAACAYTTYNCTMTRLDGFEYCSRHILEDKGAPFRQCNYIYTSTGKRCLRPAPTSDRKEGRYCGEHSRRSLVLRQRAARRRRSRETPETLLNQLSHHQMDTQTAGQNAIPDPASVTGVASASLEYASDTDSEEEITTLPHDTLPRREADSELDSADSDADPLEHSQVFTTEEITRIYLEKLKRLKSMYIGEYKRLAHILREGRRKYLQSVRQEKETMVSIHAQPKTTPEERAAYDQLRAMSRYHKHLGTHSLLYRQQLERRLQVTEGVNYKPGPSVGCVKCVYSEGSWRCGEKSVPLSKYCSKHILHDPNQVLFGACGVSRCGDDQCSMPVMCLPYTTTCIYHTPIPDPIPVSSPLLEDIENNAIDLSAEELSIQSSTSQLPPPGPQEIIDLSESHSFIVSEVPPENVMEGDGEETDEALSSETKS
ncbi:KAT8 regulatory NSL complex subunit 2-like isoform X1 [Homarus americanus]|uniref:KAT8 regulatory NSL complex subunit 2-like isoform X1 n=1 Tax=Homarus americanus TaxID=6706 RepID=UPI001C477B32|nr:KAT8 regulatory NSL complex subunit 2-like isoform X1 [Homarus americanus]